MIVGAWKTIRSIVSPKYFAPPRVRFTCGLLLMMSFYLGVTYFERNFGAATDLTTNSTVALGVGLVVLVVELEHLWARFVTRKPAAAAETATGLDNEYPEPPKNR